MKGISSTKLRTPIEYLKGVGPHKAEVFQKELNIFTFEDFLYHFPYRYVDRTKFYTLQELSGIQHAVQFAGKLTFMSVEGSGFKKRLSVILTDHTGSVELIWFRSIKWWSNKLTPGTTYVVFGKPSIFKGKVNVAHPEIEPLNTAQKNSQKGWQPVYNTTEKMKKLNLDTKEIERLQKTLIKNLLPEDVPETLPEYLLERYKIPGKFHAIRLMHFPVLLSDAKRAVKRFKFEELFYNQYRFIFNRHRRKHEVKGHLFEQLGEVFNTFYEKKLPFPLTNAQKRVIKEMRRDFLSGFQMNRLLQGDVGSGKTIVAFMLMLMAIDNDFQSCLMAPTEILAQQHYKSICELADGLNFNVALLTGNTKTAQKKKLKAALENGDIHLLIGTHALIEDDVVFRNLGLVVIDEQHRFGVAQRAKLWKKNNPPPHILVMTATPIPRTLALTQYGDLDVSVIDELPPGRKPIETFHATDKDRVKLFGFLKKEIQKGRQVYIVYPLINESEKMDYKDLMDGHDSILRSFPPPDYRVSIVHGRQKPDEKDIEMTQFVKGKTHIMVATTVIEVGVNVPNASVMVIESAERFGLSQLHQLRGRVGRGAEKSYCILMTKDNVSPEAQRRIQTMTATNDGFKIAETDLEIRGGGDMDGTRQSGAASWQQVNLAEDFAILKEARYAAETIINDDPELNKEMNAAIKYALRQLNKQADMPWNRIS